MIPIVSMCLLYAFVSACSELKSGTGVAFYRHVMKAESTRRNFLIGRGRRRRRLYDCRPPIGPRVPSQFEDRRRPGGLRRTRLV